MWVIEDSIKRVIFSVSLIDTCKFDREHLNLFASRIRPGDLSIDSMNMKWLNLPYREELLRTPTILFIKLVSIQKTRGI